MIIAVVSCWNYRDAWGPFFALLERFWPNHPKTYLLSDECSDPALVPPNINLFILRGAGKQSWGHRIAAFAESHIDEPILLMQEDFFLNAPIDGQEIRYCVGQMKERGAASVRIYPCPGADENYGNAMVGTLSRASQYRVSCQATVWEPSFLAPLAHLFPRPQDLEIGGTDYAANHITQDMLSVFRDYRPWPMSYICSAISRGKWEPDAKKFCDALEIKVDWSMRPFA